MTKRSRAAGISGDEDAGGAVDERAHLRFQRAEWRFERVGWATMLFIMASAVFGLCGSGPLSATSAAADGLVLEYDRFGRVDEPKVLSFELGPEVSADGVVRLWMDRATAEDIAIERVVPEPRAMRAERNRIVFELEAAGGTAVRMDVRLRAPGLHHGRVGIAGGPSLRFWQVVYP